jgi:transposase
VYLQSSRHERQRRLKLGFDRLKNFLYKQFHPEMFAAYSCMGRVPLRIAVTTKDEKELQKLLSGGVQQVRVVLRARALLQLSKGGSAPQIAGLVPLTPQAIRKIGHRYEEGGLERALYEKQRPGAEALLDGSEKQRIVAMACSDPPEGFARWTVRLVSEEAVKRRLVPRVGRETIRILLLSHDLKPWREKNVVREQTQ